MISIAGPWNKVGIGNHFFMYAFIRLLADRLQYKLISAPVMFSERNGVHEQKWYQFKNLDSGFDYSHKPNYSIDDKFVYDLGGLDEVVEHFQKNPSNIESSGYYQKYIYWKKYKNDVKSYFSDFLSTDNISTIQHNDVAIHLRKSLGDPRISLSSQYYSQALEKLDINKIYLFADNFNRHTDTLKVLKKYNPILMNLNVPDSIKYITSFNQIVCSQGSFSFWCAFLSRANRIIWPITQNGPNQPGYHWSIDYFIDDDDRYNFIYL